ncbi:Rad2 nuclease [Modicella reniformis]|uniref:Rad2 nuclease n=1 Tax=Modicella reniformis TaxID=1440133 RepID=A0A9P6LSN9_9FUNG|nr:Rad2 nuclease [Modicella reniformis]
MRRQHHLGIQKHLGRAFEWSHDSRQELVAFLQNRGWRVKLAEFEADLEIARDCSPDDVVLSRDSDMLAYEQVVTIWRPVKGGNVLVYNLPDVLSAIGLSRAQLTALAVVSRNDYSRNVSSLGCSTNLGIVKRFGCGGKVHVDTTSILMNRVYHTTISIYSVNDNEDAREYVRMYLECQEVVRKNKDRFDFEAPLNVFVDLKQTAAPALPHDEIPPYRTLHDLYSSLSNIQRIDSERQRKQREVTRLKQQ